MLGALPVLDGSELGQQIRLQTHRTGADTLGTADAGVGLLAHGLFARDDGHRVGTLADRHLGRRQRLTHHRATSQQLVVALGHAATGVDQVLHRRTHADQEVAGRLQAFTRHGGVALEQRLVLHHSLVDSVGRTHVLHDGTHVDGDGGRCRHLTTDDGVNQLLLTALRIALLQGDNLDVVFRSGERFGTFLGQQLDGGHLVGLNTNVSGGHLGTLHQQFQTDQNLVGMLHHQTEVGGDIRLALYGVDDDALSLGRGRWGQLDEGGETGTAHTYDTGILDAADNLLGGQLGMLLDGLQLVGAVDGLFPLVAFYINYNNGLAIASSVDGGIDLEYGTADRREDRSTDKTASLGNHSTHLHLVALLYDGLGGSTNVLRQREDGLLRQRSHLGLGLVGQLILFGVYTTNTECSYVHACSSFFSLVG